MTREQVKAVLEFAARSLDAPGSEIAAAVNAATPGSFTEVEIPLE